MSDCPVCLGVPGYVHHTCGKVGETRYVVFPGYVISQSDGQRHYVNAKELIGLYGIDPNDCIIIDRTNPASPVYKERQGDIRLVPKANGDYTIPEG